MRKVAEYLERTQIENGKQLRVLQNNVVLYLTLKKIQIALLHRNIEVLNRYIDELKNLKFNQTPDEKAFNESSRKNFLQVVYLETHKEHEDYNLKFNLAKSIDSLREAMEVNEKNYERFLTAHPNVISKPQLNQLRASLAEAKRL